MSVKSAEPEPGKQWKHDTEAGQDSHVTFPVLERKPSATTQGSSHVFMGQKDPCLLLYTAWNSNSRWTITDLASREKRMAMPPNDSLEELHWKDQSF